jgi:HK97 family phage portal protein
MSLFHHIKQTTQPQNTQQQQEESRSYFSNALSFNSISSYVSSQSMRLSAVFSATNAISNAVATLPINVYINDNQGYKSINYTNPVQNLLNLQPSPNLSRYNFFKLIVESIILKGNSYALIIRDKKGIVTEIKYIPAEWVTVSFDYLLSNITYTIAGYPKPFKQTDILHFWLYSNDTVHGISVIQYGYDTLKGANDAEKHAANYFKSGASQNGLLKANSTLTDAQKEQIRTAWNAAFDNPATAGVAVIPANMDYQNIAINPKDSMLLESRQFNVIEICRFFNISPVKIFDLSHSSYSSLEQTQLSFLEDTIKPYLFLIENEFNRKLFSTTNNISVKFDVTEMLSTDKVTTANYITTLLKNGVISVNEARQNLGYNKIVEGDENYIQLNMSTLKNINKGVVTTEQQKIQQKTKSNDENNNDENKNPDANINDNSEI